jgi:hypothetical protein
MNRIKVKNFLSYRNISNPKQKQTEAEKIEILRKNTLFKFLKKSQSRLQSQLLKKY